MVDERDEPIYFSDIIDTRPLQPKKITPEERARFVADVDEEMRRLGFDEANRLTELSERMTANDYRVYINY